MTSASVSTGGANRCVLLAGAPECRCPDEAPYLDDAEIRARGQQKFRWQQRAAPEGRAAARRGLDALLDHARRRASPRLVAALLRMSAMIRIMAADPGDADDVDGFLVEYTELAERAGGATELGDAATLRAHRTAVFDHAENALTDTAVALAVLTDINGPEAGEDVTGWAQQLAQSLNGLVLVLLKLGLHELADEVSQRSVAVAEVGRSPMDRLVHQLNRVRLQVSWALRLERGGRVDAAATHLAAAARTASAAALLWAPAHGHDPATHPLTGQECAVIAAAHALQRPGPEHLDRLRAVLATTHFIDDLIMVAIATARCLVAAARPREAAGALAPLHARLQENESEPALALALHREFSRVDALAGGARPDALGRYAEALEGELWALREARLTAVRSHAEHHRLAREHGAIAAQALQDPLTGLPNRRALDLRLAEVDAGAGAGPPCAVALVDLDGFKDVNDARSHAAGDAVLREVAACLRAVLRSQDLVTRYGGDEFVVIMPATTLPVAGAALRRATEAVAALPTDVAAGVTMSVGVARLVPGAPAGAALAAADAAMYRAKHAGGNTVVIDGVPVVAVPAQADDPGAERRPRQRAASGRRDPDAPVMSGAGAPRRL